MHYFKRNIGDYHKKAGRLTMLEHGAYTLLMDAYYDRERPPTKQDAIEWTWAKTADELAAVALILDKFFTLDGDVYRNKRIDEELQLYREIAIKNKQIAEERERKRAELRARSVHEACTKRARSVHESSPNHKPLTTNQEPLYKSYGASLNARAWVEYLDYRKKAKVKKLTEAGEHKQIKWLIAQGPPELQQQIIDQTIANGWTGLFELKRGGNNGQSQQSSNKSKPSLAERATEHRERAERIWAEQEADEQSMGADGSYVRPPLDGDFRRDGD